MILGVVVIIALFYTGDLSTTALAVGFKQTAALFLLNAKQVTRLTPYVVVGAILLGSSIEIRSSRDISWRGYRFCNTTPGEKRVASHHSNTWNMHCILMWRS